MNTTEKKDFLAKGGMAISTAVLFLAAIGEPSFSHRVQYGPALAILALASSVAYGGARGLRIAILSVYLIAAVITAIVIVAMIGTMPSPALRAAFAMYTYCVSSLAIIILVAASIIAARKKL